MFDGSDPVAAAERERWNALVRLADAVETIKRLPEDVPREVPHLLADHLDKLELEYRAAYERRREVLEAA